MAVLTIFLGFFAIASLVILFVTVSSFIGFVRTKVPQLPTAARDIRRMAEEGLLRKDDVLIDLGCSTGQVLFATEKIVGCRGRGYEVALWACVFAWMRKILTRSKAEVVWGNFFDADLSDATVIYAYLYPFLMPKVGEKIKSSCKPGTKVISRDFRIESLKLVKRINTYAQHAFFIYEV